MTHKSWVSYLLAARRDHHQLRPKCTIRSHEPKILHILLWIPFSSLSIFDDRKQIHLLSLVHRPNLFKIFSIRLRNWKHTCDFGKCDRTKYIIPLFNSYVPEYVKPLSTFKNSQHLPRLLFFSSSVSETKAIWERSRDLQLTFHHLLKINATRRTTAMLGSGTTVTTRRTTRTIMWLTNRPIFLRMRLSQGSADIWYLRN